MGRSFIRGNGFHRKVQASADGLRNVAASHSLFGHRVVLDTGLLLLQCEPIQAGRVEDVYGRPAVGSIAHIRDYAALACQRDCVCDESLLDRIVHIGKAHDGNISAPRRERLFAEIGQRVKEST